MKKGGVGRISTARSCRPTLYRHKFFGRPKTFSGKIMANPTPTNVLKVRGTFRKDRQGGRSNVNAKSAKPTKPRAITGEAAKEWDRITTELAALSIVAKVDRALLSIYCRAWADWRECVKRLEELSKKEADETNDKRAWRLGIQRNRLEDRLIKIADRFGLSPVARARLACEPDEAPKPSKASYFADAN